MMNTASLTKTPEMFGREKTEVARQPGSTHIVLNSADRFNNSTPDQTRAVSAAWNNFRLQKPQALLAAYARRIQVTEVRFPWYIPNVTSKNDEFVIIISNPAPVVLEIGIPTGFYTQASLVSTINGAILGEEGNAGLLPGSAPTLAVVNNVIRFAAGSLPFALASPISNFSINVPQAPLMSLYQYQTLPSLLRTLGVDFRDIVTTYTPLSGGFIAPGNFIQANPSTYLYTDFVDIVSDKLNYFADVQDGGSSNLSPPNLVCRLYLADEISLTSANPPGTNPFIIHRQFKTPKTVKWDPTAYIDALDIAVYDQYGKLVPLPGSVRAGAYPDFQITLLASES
jgi:hypothetical protein